MENISLEAQGALSTLKYVFWITATSIVISTIIGIVVRAFELAKSTNRKTSRLQILLLLVVTLFYLIIGVLAETNSENLDFGRFYVPLSSGYRLAYSIILLFFGLIVTAGVGWTKSFPIAFLIAFIAAFLGGLMGVAIGHPTYGQTTLASLGGPIVSGVAATLVYRFKGDIKPAIQAIVSEKVPESAPLILVAAFLTSMFVLFMAANVWGQSERFLDICNDVYGEADPHQQNLETQFLFENFTARDELRKLPPSNRRDALFWKVCVDHMWQYGEKYSDPSSPR